MGLVLLEPPQKRIPSHNQTRKERNMNDTKTDIPGIKHLWRWQEDVLVTSAGEKILTADITGVDSRQLTLLASSPFLYRFLAALLQEWQQNPLSIAAWVREHST